MVHIKTSTILRVINKQIPTKQTILPLKINQYYYRNSKDHRAKKTFTQKSKNY